MQDKTGTKVELGSQLATQSDPSRPLAWVDRLDGDIAYIKWIYNRDKEAFPIHADSFPKSDWVVYAKIQ